MKENQEYQLVTMKIPIELYTKSKALIPDRTKDYIDHLNRRIATSDRASMIQRELDEIKTRQEFLEHELELELGLKEEEEKVSGEYNDIFKQAIQTIRNIINAEGCIGMDKMESIAALKDISFAELKINLPEDILEKVVNYHPQYVEKVDSQFARGISK